MNGIILTASEKTLCALPRYWVSYQPNIQKCTHISEMALSEYRISSTAPDHAHEQDGLADLWRWMFAGPELVWHSCGTPSSGDRNSRHFATDNASGPAYTNPSNASSFFELFQMFFFLQSVFPNQWKETAVTPVHIGDLMQTPQNTVWFPSWVLISKDFG